MTPNRDETSGSSWHVEGFILGVLAGLLMAAAILAWGAP